MKSSLLAMGVVGLAGVGLWFFGGGTQALPKTRGGDVPHVSAPLAHENLTVYFIHGPDAVPDAKVMSLQEALDRELAIVHETSNVNTLAVENLAPDCELFIQSGDIVKGGKQDRMAATDMLLPPKSGVVALPAHCVEQGRWTARGNEESRRFKSSDNCVAGKALKYANYTGQQQAVWDGVRQEQMKVSANVGASVNAPASPSSFQLTLESPAVQAKVAEYESSLKAAGQYGSDIIGVVFVVNGQVTGAEVYGSNALFRKAWPKLLTASAVEAVAERTDKPTAIPPSAREVERFLAYGANPEPIQAHGNEPGTIVPTEPTDDPIVVRLTTVRRSHARGDTPNENNRERFNPAGLNDAENVSLQGHLVLPPPALDQAANPNNEIPPAELAARLRRARPANPAPNPPSGQEPSPLPPAGAAGFEVQLGAPAPGDHRQLFQFSAGVFGSDGQRVQPPPPPPANNANTGNQLNSNRTENRSTLMVESRDPKRQNAVIHRSYIKK